jgi:hypothetical protein
MHARSVATHVVAWLRSWLVCRQLYNVLSVTYCWGDKRGRMREAGHVERVVEVR